MSTLWSILTNWAVVGVVWALSVGIGVGVMSMTPPDFVVARIAFTVALLLSLIKAALWLADSRDTRYLVLIAFFAFGVLGATWALAMKYVSHREALWRLAHPESAPQPESKPVPSLNAELRFRDDIEDVRVSVNDHELPRSLVYLETQGIDLDKVIKIPGRVYVRNRKPYFDGTIKAGARHIEIKENRVVQMPDGWDENFNDRACELVNEGLRVVFRIVLESAAHISIDAGHYINNKHHWRERVFRYPSSEHPGEFTSDIKERLTPLSVKTLYQLFLTDCRGTRSQHTLESKHKIEWVLCRNPDSKSAHLNVYVPYGNPEPAISSLAKEHRTIIGDFERAGFLRGMVFTGLVYVYHDYPLREQQKAALAEEFRNNETEVRFRGPEYEVAENSPIRALAFS